MITTEQVKALREKTGVSVMQCKKALEQADGDEEQAIANLKQKSREVAEKKSDRELGSGKIVSYIHGGGSVGVLLELSAETDFVAGNEEFGQLASDIAMHVAALAPSAISREDISEEEKKGALEAIKQNSAGELEDKADDIKEKILDGKMESFYKENILLEQAFVKDPDTTINDLIKNHVQKFGERIEVTRFERYALLEG